MAHVPLYPRRLTDTSVRLKTLTLVQNDLPSGSQIWDGPNTQGGKEAFRPGRKSLTNTHNCLSLYRFVFPVHMTHISPPVCCTQAYSQAQGYLAVSFPQVKTLQQQSDILVRVCFFSQHDECEWEAQTGTRIPQWAVRQHPTYLVKHYSSFLRSSLAMETK